MYSNDATKRPITAERAVGNLDEISGVCDRVNSVIYVDDQGD